MGAGTLVIPPSIGGVAASCVTSNPKNASAGSREALRGVAEEVLRGVAEEVLRGVAEADLEGDIRAGKNTDSGESLNDLYS